MAGRVCRTSLGDLKHDPRCAHESMMRFLMSVIAGKQPKIDKVGLSYMLLGEARQGQNIPTTKDPSKVKQWFYTGPHIMVVLPDDAEKSRH